jgi:osmotically-inducible protein OsmY
MIRITVVVATVVLAVPATSFAQSRSLFGSNGPTGGQSTIGSSSSMTRSGSTTSRNQSQGLTAGGNSNSLNLPTGPQSATIGGQAITLSGETGFVGRSDSMGTFVGNSRAGQQQGGNSAPGVNSARQNANSNRAFGAAGNTNRLGNNNFQNFQGNNNVFGQFGNQNQQAVKGVLRPQQRINFQYTPPATMVVATQIGTRFQGLERMPAMRSINVSPTPNGVVILRGKVGSEDHKKLAAAMARLEPGVREVRNELVVSP